MKVLRTSFRRSLAVGFAVVATLSGPGAVPKALAQDSGGAHKFAFLLGAARALVTAVDNKSNEPLPPKENLAWAIIQGFATKAAPAAPIIKALANYGALSPIPGTKGSDDCLFSLGNALDPSGNFLYMSGGIGSGRLCGFAIDPVTQAWTPITPTGAVGTNPRAVAIDPSGRFVYVAGDFTGTVSGFSIDPTTGAPTPLPGSPYPTLGSLPIPMVIDRGGRFLYVGQSVGSFDGSIAVFAIDATTGALSHIAGSPFPNAANFGRVAALALSPDGRFLFTGGTALATYSVNSATGVPTRIASRAGLCCSLVVDPTGRFLFGADTDGLHGFSIAADGTLAPAGTPRSIGAVTRVTTAIASVADLVYVGNSGTGDIYGFRINPSTGALTAVSGSPFAATPLPSAFAATANLPAASQVDVGDNVVASVGVYGGRPPYTWSIASGTLPPGSALNTTTGIFSGVLNTAGTYSFTVQVVDSLGATVSETRSITVGGGSAPAAVAVVEYYNAVFDHYFITPVAVEIGLLDAKTPPFQDWSRTGFTFNGYVNATAPAGSVAICRFFNSTFAPKSSHFYAPHGLGCEATLSTFPDWKLEDDKLFNAMLPDAGGVCPAGTVPVYRLYNNGMGGAPNHRFVTSLAERQTMIGKGYVPEGSGIGVGMCAPQ